MPYSPVTKTVKHSNKSFYADPAQLLTAPVDLPEPAGLVPALDIPVIDSGTSRQVSP